jgi:hypothetical protein
MARIVELRVDTQGNRFGAVRGGFIRIHSRLCAILVKFNEHGYRWVAQASTSPSSGKDVIEMEIRLDEEIRGDESWGAFCIELGLNDDPSLSHESRCESQGLLLQPTGQRKGEFRRMGRYLEEIPSDRHYSKLQAAFACSDVEEEHSEERDENGLFTVRII